MTDIQKLMMAMLISVRIGVGVIGIAFPVILWGVGEIAGVPMANSMSAYYHATHACSIPPTSGDMPAACLAQGEGPMRNWFVGNLFFIGAAMYLIKGFSRWENYALNVAGVMAPCVALIPMPWPVATGYSIHTLHYVCAVLFFLCVGFTCVFCADKTLKELPPGPNKDKLIAFYKRVYRILAGVMILAPVAGWGAGLIWGHGTFALEMAGIWAFGAYWLVKTWELHRSDVERRAMRGELVMNTKSLR